MSRNDFERFLEDLKNDPELRREFESLGTDTDSVIRWANGLGYQFSREETAELIAGYGGEISDDDLEKVAGGWCGNEMTTG